MSTVYEIITEHILDSLTKGEVPWHRPWIGGEPPMNLTSGKPYRGVNVFTLSMSKYASPYWITYKQAVERGGQVRKGEKGMPVVFWKWAARPVETLEGEQATHSAPILRYYTVFNVEQCDGLTYPKPELRPDFKPTEECERIVKDMPDAPVIGHAEPRAYYRPLTDNVNMPDPRTFNGPEEYYSTLFHELTHSTGHSKRLNRSTLADVCPFGSTNYSKEELVAEMGAAFLCGTAKIENRTIDNSAAYIQSWLTKLKGDPRLVVLAGAQAQKAADFILGRTYADSTA